MKSSGVIGGEAVLIVGRAMVYLTVAGLEELFAWGCPMRRCCGQEGADKDEGILHRRAFQERMLYVRIRGKDAMHALILPTPRAFYYSSGG